MALAVRVWALAAGWRRKRKAGAGTPASQGVIQLGLDL